MNALLLSAVLLFVIVGIILASAGEFGKGGDAVKGAVTLIVLCAMSGFVTALASGSM